MPLPTITPLGATTLARKWKLDVDCSIAQDGSDYRRLMGQTDFTFNPGTAQMQSDTDYDSGGFASSTATGLEWGGTVTIRRAPKRLTPTAYDDAQEYLRIAGRKMGSENTVRIRVYEYGGASGPKVESYEGYVAVAYANAGGDPGALSTATLTLTGQGELVAITHPDNAAVAAPTVTALAYSTGTNVAAAGGGLIIITGTGFSTATAVTVFGNVAPVADWEAVSDTKMAIKVPAHAAGTGNVTVTNPGGTSGTSAANQIVYV